MTDLSQQKDIILGKLAALQGELPKLVAKKENLFHKRLKLLTDAALAGNDAPLEVASFDKELADLERAIADNGAISANLEIKLLEVEQCLRIDNIAQSEAEYVTVLDTLDTLPDKIEEAFTTVEMTINGLHNLTQAYWAARQRRKALSTIFWEFMKAEKLERICPRLTSFTLAEDDAFCKSLDDAVIGIDCKIIDFIQARKLDCCALRLALFR